MKKCHEKPYQRRIVLKCTEIAEIPEDLLAGSLNDSWNSFFINSRTAGLLVLKKCGKIQNVVSSSDFEIFSPEMDAYMTLLVNVDRENRFDL